MAVKFYTKPEFREPSLVAAWYGRCQVAFVVVSYLKHKLNAELFGEIEPYGFFDATDISVRDNIVEKPIFPENTFYYSKNVNNIMLFIGEDQPIRSYKFANNVLNVAQQFNVKRIYTFAAEYAPIHHTKESSVRGVVTHTKLVEDLDRYGIPVITKPGREIILGLNGLLLGVAKERDLEGICLLGEVPVYIRSVLPYPKASRSILKYLTRMLNVEFDFHKFDKYVKDVEKAIEEDYRRLDEESRQLIDKLKFPEISTEEVFKELDEIFRKNKEEKC